MIHTWLQNLQAMAYTARGPYSGVYPVVRATAPAVFAGSEQWLIFDEVLLHLTQVAGLSPRFCCRKSSVRQV